MKVIGVLGAGSQAAETAGYLIESGYKVEFFFTESTYLEKNSILEKIAPIFTEKNIPNKFSKTKVVSAVGSPFVRKRLVEIWPYNNFTNFIHKTAWLAKEVEIGEDVTISPMCVINADVKISSHVLINIGSTISHDTSLDKYATISPNVAIAGKVTVGEGVFLGIGSNVIDNVVIKGGAVVAAGSTVTKDIDEAILVAGVPAVMKKLLTTWYK